MAEGTYVRYDASELTIILRELERRGRNLTHVVENLAEELVAQVQEVFVQEGAVGGRPRWPELAEATKEQRRGSEPYTILQDTGVMAGSIMPAHLGLVAEAYTDVPYAKYHVSDEPRTKIPKRDFFAIDFDAFTDGVVDMLLQELAG